MALSDCSFRTDRMDVDDWARFLTGDNADEVLNTFLVSLLSEAVTRDLPLGWQGLYDEDRASLWFGERRREGPTLLIVDRSEGRPVGLLILVESGSTRGLVDIRLGYLIHEDLWGTGLATEVVAGFVDWCRTNGAVRSIVGGVTHGNAASARVLQRNGFVPADSVVEPHGVVEYRLLFVP